MSLKSDSAEVIRSPTATVRIAGVFNAKANLSRNDCLEVRQAFEDKLDEFGVRCRYHEASSSAPIRCLVFSCEFAYERVNQELRGILHMGELHSTTMRHADRLVILRYLIDDVAIKANSRLHLRLSKNNTRPNAISRLGLHWLYEDGREMTTNYDTEYEIKLMHTLVSKKYLSAEFPLTNMSELEGLTKTWAFSFRQQPLEAIYSYFGSEISFYFAWLGIYACALLPLAVWSVFGTRFFDYFHGILTNGQFFVLNGILLAIWSTLFLEVWRSKEIEYCYHWDLLDHKDVSLEVARPAFKGTRRISPVTGQPELFFPAWKRSLIVYFISYPILAITMAVFIAWQILVLRGQRAINEYAIGTGPVPSNILHLASMLLLTVNLYVINLISEWISSHLAEMENHKTEERHAGSRLSKLVALKCCSAFFSPLYSTFVRFNPSMLRHQLIVLLVMRQVVGNVQEVVLPMAKRIFMTARIAQYMKNNKNMPNKPARDQDGEEDIDRRPTVLQRRTVDDRVTKRARVTIVDDTSAHMSNDKFDTWEAKPAPVSLGAVKETVVIVFGMVKGLFVGKEKESDNNIDQQAQMEEQLYDENPEVEHHAVLEQSLLAPYQDTFEDYLEMFIQFGLVVMFMPVYPTAAVWAFINNVMEVRVDAIKLCKLTRRPHPNRRKGIGIWRSSLQTMSFVGVLMATAMTLCFGYLPSALGRDQADEKHFAADMSQRDASFDFATLTRNADAEGVVLLFAVEHVLLLVKMMLHSMLASGGDEALLMAPAWLQMELAKLEHRRRTAFKAMRRRIGLSATGSSQLVEGHRE